MADATDIKELDWDFVNEALVFDWGSDRDRYRLFVDNSIEEQERIEMNSYYQESIFEDYTVPKNQKKGKAGAAGGYKRCYHNHKPLSLGDGLQIYGGSCNSPAVKEADIYIGFDHGMKLGSRSYPWNSGADIKFLIPDGQAPGDVEEFKKLVAWTIEQIRNGSKVHAGCIGGHGRTGTFFAAVVMEMTGNKDAIKYVREHYCKKAVESQEQVDWLHKNFGTNKAKPSRSWGSTSKSAGGYYGGSKKDPIQNSGTAPNRVHNYYPIRTSTSIWGKNFSK